jgi:hypothetical protein
MLEILDVDIHDCIKINLFACPDDKMKDIHNERFHDVIPMIDRINFWVFLDVGNCTKKRPHVSLPTEMVTKAMTHESTSNKTIVHFVEVARDVIFDELTVSRGFIELDVQGVFH